MLIETKEKYGYTKIEYYFFMNIRYLKHNMVEQIKIYKLQPKQREFTLDTHKFRLIWWARWGGKSYAMRAECVKQCMWYPNLRWLVLRRTMPEIIENMVVPMLMEVPKDCIKFNASKNIMTFNNKSTIRFSYCKNKKDVLNYQGLEYDFMCIEELTHWSEDEFKILVWSLRTTKNYEPNFFASTNPWWIWHKRVRRIWIDRKFNRDENPDHFSFIPAKIYDNKYLIEKDPAYLARLQMLPEMKRRAFLEWDWDAFEGQFFDEFRREIHVIKPFVPTRREVKRRIISIDYWFSNESAVYWMCLDTQWNIIVYREYYKPKNTYFVLAWNIKKRTTSEETIDMIVWDPSFVNKRSESNETTAQKEFKKQWLRLYPGNNERIDWWDIVREYLKPYKDPNTWDITSRLKITSNCENLIRTLPEMIYDDIKVEDMMKKGMEDHAVDSLRYWIMELAKWWQSMKEIRELNQWLNKDYIELWNAYKF